MFSDRSDKMITEIIVFCDLVLCIFCEYWPFGWTGDHITDSPADALWAWILFKGRDHQCWEKKVSPLTKEPVTFLLHKPHTI